MIHRVCYIPYSQYDIDQIFSISLSKDNFRIDLVTGIFQMDLAENSAVSNVNRTIWIRSSPKILNAKFQTTD